MAERDRTRHPDNTIQRLRHDPRPRLPPYRRLGTRPLTLDASAQLHSSRSHQGYVRSHHRRQLLRRPHHQYRFAFGDLLCFPLQEHERLWKFDFKNDIGFYLGDDEDSVKGGSVIFMLYTHNFVTRGNGHRILISDIQLLQWYSQRCDIRRNPLPYSVVKDAVMDLLVNRETTVTRTGATQLLITPALTDAGTPALAVIQHAVPSPTTPIQTQPSSRPRTALLPISPPASIRRDSRTRAKTIFYKPHDIRAVSTALREILDRENPPSPIFATDNDSQRSDTDIMRSNAIDTLSASEYYR